MRQKVGMHCFVTKVEKAKVQMWETQMELPFPFFLFLVT